MSKSKNYFVTAYFLLMVLFGISIISTTDLELLTFNEPFRFIIDFPFSVAEFYGFLPILVIAANIIFLLYMHETIKSNHSHLFLERTYANFLNKNYLFAARLIDFCNNFLIFYLSPTVLALILFRYGDCQDVWGTIKHFIYFTLDVWVGYVYEGYIANQSSRKYKLLSNLFFITVYETILIIFIAISPFQIYGHARDYDSYKSFPWQYWATKVNKDWDEWSYWVYIITSGIIGPTLHVLIEPLFPRIAIDFSAPDRNILFWEPPIHDWHHNTDSNNVVFLKKFSDLNASHRNLRYAVLGNNGVINHANFYKANLQRALITGGWHNANFNEVASQHIHVEYADLNGAIFLGANLSDSFMNEVEFAGSNFQNANLNNSSHLGVSFLGSDFRNTQLLHADFWHSSLIGADFRNTKLYGVIFEACNLQGADLTDSDWLAASLYSVHFEVLTHNKLHPMFVAPLFKNKTLFTKENSDWNAIRSQAQKIINKEYRDIYLQRVKEAEKLNGQIMAQLVTHEVSKVDLAGKICEKKEMDLKTKEFILEHDGFEIFDNAYYHSVCALEQCNNLLTQLGWFDKSYRCKNEESPQTIANVDEKKIEQLPSEPVISIKGIKIDMTEDEIKQQLHALNIDIFENFSIANIKGRTHEPVELQFNSGKLDKFIFYFSDGFKDVQQVVVSKYPTMNCSNKIVTNMYGGQFDNIYCSFENSLARIELYQNYQGMYSALVMTSKRLINEHKESIMQDGL